MKAGLRTLGSFALSKESRDRTEWLLDCGSTRR